MTKEKTLIVIGAGIGGLFTGALMAQNGYNVTVLEKNQTIGGGLQCFRRRSKIFETGMHVMGGFEPGGNLSKIGLYDKIVPQMLHNKLNILSLEQKQRKVPHLCLKKV